VGISLEKGGRINLSKEAPGMTKIRVGLGWDVRVTDGTAFDLDASIIMVNAQGKAPNEGAFVFYNNKKSACGSVEHMGDNKTGEGTGDDEVISVTLSTLPAEIERLVVAVTIHEAESRNQNFGQIDNAYIRITNADTNEEIARYDLTEDYSTATSLIFGEVYKKDAQWRFSAKGDGFAGGLGKLLETFGLA
jgi:tellurium resistance protein TerD